MTQQTASRHRAAGRTRVLGRPSLRLLGAALTVLVVVMVTAGTTWFSGASFTAGSNTLARVGAASDYHPPRVSVTSPGATVQGAVQVQAVASDTGSGVNRVVIEYAAAGSTTWIALCTDPTAPYACAWDTTRVNDGDYQLRATATDNVGTTATSATVTTRVANPAAVTLTTIPEVVRGTVPLSATVTGAGSRSTSSAFQFRVADTAGWTTVSSCGAVTGTSPTCSWVTGTLADLYDVRVLTTLGSGGSAPVVEDLQADVTVDNLAPTVTVTAPSPMSGTVQVTATATDEDSGIATVALSYRRQGTTTWIALCTDSTDPYRCALDTTTLTNLATYELRAIATDNAGNSTTSATTSRQVNNGLASITITSPLTGDLVSGTTTITTDYSTPFGTTASNVRIEARRVGGSFATVCNDPTAPFTCDWATASLTSGTWELQATMTYGLALTATSPIVTVTIDNAPLKALDVEAGIGSTSGKASAGDTLVLTYQGSVDLTTIKTGWTGASTPLTLTLRDKAVATATASDRATFDVNLGTVLFAQNYVKANKSVAIPATMVATTNPGAGTTTITITLGSISSGDLRSATATGAMRWTPSAVARTPGGVACSTTTAVESGAADREF